MLVAEGMNSRRSRRALVLCMAPMREHGAGGAFSAIFIDVVELATIEPGVRADLATQGGSTFTFAWYALIARTPDWSRLDASGAGVGCGATSARPYCARRASDCAIFFLASACRASAFCIASRVARFSLLAVPHAPARLESLMRLLLLGRSGIEHRTLRCCDFHSVLFCAFHSARVRRCFFGPRRAIPQWIATWA